MNKDFPEIVNEEVSVDKFNEAAEEIQSEMGAHGLSSGYYEEFARAVHNRYIKNRKQSLDTGK